MTGKILFSLFCLALFGHMQAQTTITNTAFTGTIIGTYSSTLSQCQYWCQNQYVVGCVAYTFDSSSSVCQFFSSVSSSGSSSTQTSGYVTSTSSTTTTTTTITTAVAGTVLSNTAYTGTVIGTFNTTQAQCSYYCQAQYVAGCIGWTFNPTTGVCQFFSVITGTTTSSGVLSALVPATTTTASTTTTTQTTTATTTTTTTATTTTTRASLGTTTVPPTTTKTYFCAATSGINYPINNLTQVTATSANDCCNQCGMNPSCFAFAYQTPYNTCLLKTATPAPGAAYVNDSSIIFGNLISH